MNGAVQTFRFAVLDGPDPKGWLPFGGAGKTFEVLREECLAYLSSGSASEEPPRVAFNPMLETMAELLESDRLHGVVGAIIQADVDPTDILFYDEKMTCLQKLCERIRASANPELSLLNKVERFEIWFVINGTDSDKWERWANRARDIIKVMFNHHPRIDYLPTASWFPHMARRFLSESRYVMLRGKG